MIFKPSIWKILQADAKKIKKTNMREMFATDSKRAEKYTRNLDNMIVDFSKNIIDEKVFNHLIALAKEAKLSEKIAAMFEGKRINITENRPVLHIALRNLGKNPIYVDGKDVMPQIKTVFEKMANFSEAVRLGKFKGHTGKKLKNIVNIGIGGSDLGPRMAIEALKSYAPKDMQAFFISNIDGTACAEVLSQIKPEETLFIVASKTFTTIETLTNAKTCRKWLVDALGEPSVAKHFVALSTNEIEVVKFGINPDNMFEFWDFVGGRYSMWSAIGLSIALMIGYDNFAKMLDGANAMDKHFQTTKFENNIPVILALIGIWYNNFFDYKSQAVIPYDEYLRLLPDYLQQLDMESNGKSICNNQEASKHLTAPVLFGGAGTNVQHSFFQLIHQGTTPIPVDLIMPAISHNEIGVHHEILMSNFLAQGEALMKGKTVAEAYDEMIKSGVSKERANFLKKFTSFSGNRPTNSIVFKKLDPKSLGMLVAMYEHKVFTQGVIWNIDSFDQWGVELGKQLATAILPELQGTSSSANRHDSSTSGLIKLFKKLRK